MTKCWHSFVNVSSYYASSINKCSTHTVAYSVMLTGGGRAKPDPGNIGEGSRGGVMGGGSLPW